MRPAGSIKAQQAKLEAAHGGHSQAGVQQSTGDVPHRKRSDEVGYLLNETN